MLCHPCAPGRQCWLSQQVAPLCQCQCQTFSPQGKFLESPCHTKAHVVSFSSHEKKGYMSVTALFKWVQLFPILIASFHIHSQSCRHWKALVQRKKICFLNSNSTCFFFFAPVTQQKVNSSYLSAVWKDREHDYISFFLSDVTQMILLKQ